MQCFLCGVKLDGWEAEDDALAEHLAHSATCVWAQALYAGLAARQNDDAVNADPMSEDQITARRGTFEHNNEWPHENKKGWKCKIQKMVEAGFCHDPAPIVSGEEDDGDGVTCFYCTLSLDGWEPKDDPLQEHKRRTPDCAFFALGGGVVKKGTKGKKGARGSTASKASRLSTQSTMSEAPMAAEDVDEDALAMDDSIASNGTNASQATVTGAKKGTKKGGRPKAAAKGAKGKKKASSMLAEAEDPPQYRDMSSQAQNEMEEEIVVSPAPSAAQPAKKKRGRPSKQPLDTSVVEVSSMDVAPAKKTTRGKKAKAQPEPEFEIPADEEVDAQLQEELENSMDLASQDLDQSTPQAEPAKPKRGVKRTSDGLRKREEESEVSVIAVEFPVPPQPAAAPATKNRGRKPSKQAATEQSQIEAMSQQPEAVQEDTVMSEAEPSEPAKGEKGAAKGKGRKASSTRSSKSRTSKTKAAEPEEPTDDRPEDLDRDEQEIEAELARIAAEQATAARITQGMAEVQSEQERSAEYEPSPSHHPHQEKHVRAIEHLEHELQAEVEQLGQPGQNLANYVQKVAKPSMSMPGAFSPTPEESPAGSDKENLPSSAHQATITKQVPVQPQYPISQSPTKAVRIPLAPSTPNKLVSPSKRTLLLSPSKQPLGQLTSTTPWCPADLDELLMASPQATPGTLAARFAVQAGKLGPVEKGLTVEEWVRWNAERAEEELRRRCERMVGVFEGEGVRAMQSLGGVVTA